jgi:exopolysaccharide biosynthesis protein
VRVAWKTRLVIAFLITFIVPAYGESGFSYEHRTSNEPWSIHIAVVDPGAYRIEAVRAQGKGLGRETVSSLARRSGAFLAINGGFFRIGSEYDGEPVGVLKINQDWYSDPALPRAALGWTSDGKRVSMARLSMGWEVQVGGSTFKIDGINRERGAYQVVLYGDGFHQSTLTHGGGQELRVSSDGRVIGVETSGNAVIPDGGIVVSFGSRVADRVPAGCIGMKVSTSFNLSSPDRGDDLANWKDLDFIVGGTPLLIRDGQAVESYEVERVQKTFVEDRHPRTAVGIREDGSWVFVVVDGRRPGVSLGMSLDELTLLMRSLGCNHALNLDGGGSSTFYLSGQILNQPSDLTGERPVSDAIVVHRRHRE